MRGLVVSPPIELTTAGFHLKSSALDPQELRTNLLFWDKLDFPSNNLIGFGLSEDTQFLVDSGILQRTHVQVVGAGAMGNLFRAAHVEAYRKLDQEQPGQWSLATGEKSISFVDDDLSMGRGALVRLYKAIPVPDKEVPLLDILEFKAKREAELLALRHQLEETYQKIVAAGDGELALNTEIEKLEAAIADQIKASKESNLKFRLADLTANINLLPIVTAGIGAFVFGLPLIPSLITGAATSFSLDTGVSLKGKKANSTPWRYVTSYHNEIFGGQ